MPSNIGLLESNVNLCSQILANWLYLCGCQNVSTFSYKGEKRKGSNPTGVNDLPNKDPRRPAGLQLEAADPSRRGINIRTQQPVFIRITLRGD